jgi:hypothetical protein
MINSCQAWRFLSSSSKVPRCSRVATLANCKVITAKRAPAIMASHTALPATGRVMIKGLRRSNLFTLWHSGPDLVTFRARNFLVL